MSRFRYSRWDGTQTGFELEADDILDQVTDDLLYHGDLNAALRRLMQSGMRDANGERIQGIREMLEKSDLSPFVKKHALGIFRRIAEAEGKIHGMSVEDVHFHEVGALDSIADIVCACAGFEALGVETIYGHMSGFACIAGQTVVRGQVIGYVGHSGRTTGSHLHYEVRIRNTPVNPHKYLRTTLADLGTEGPKG